MLHPVRSAVLALACLAFVSGCPGSNTPTNDAGVDALPTDAHPAGCISDAECDDGVFCNGMETCSAGHCVARMLACDDGIACTIDTCSESVRSCRSHPPDADHDGAYDARCIDSHGTALGTDCVDTDANDYPGNTEVCDHHDEDCDPTTLGGVDMDHDGAISDACCNPTATGLVCGLDCDDTNPSISRLATEICDGVDNDCDHLIDEGVRLMAWPDVDGDGYGDASATPMSVCQVPSSQANEGGDCNDMNVRIHPHQTEECNGVDDDCDGTIDEGATAACNGAFAGTTGECLNGACVVTGCDATHFDCNGLPADGCEASLCTDYHTCGSCTRACSAGTTYCGGGLCAGINAMLAMRGTLHDVTGAPVANATITSIGICPVITATTAADGTYTLGPATSMPNYVRISAPGYPTHVQGHGQTDAFGPIIPSTLFDAWTSDPDRAASPSAMRSMLVIDYGGGGGTVIHTGDIGTGNEAVGSDLLPTPGPGMRQVFFDVVPGSMTVGGTWSDGAGCSINCNGIGQVRLWTEPGAVTYVPGNYSCAELCA
jgi:hypothetical protein